ncbi:hypothetical protein [Ruegeria sp. 6PALISEP08]|uniref:hypothetical protein n=1 Tax=Ruegeria sp. 6PALISEP08 TaxID=1225660 RepID=UPI00067F7308|nr:hypothetical protein [Ruegeria sp. 6PALISEP08]
MNEKSLPRSSMDTRNQVSQALNVPDVQVELSNSAALRAFHGLSRHAQAMLMAIIRWVSCEEHVSDNSPILRAAADEAGVPEWSARRGVNELISSGLLRRTKQSAMVLHPMFSVIGHQLRRAVNSSSGNSSCIVFEIASGGRRMPTTKR